jgi:hypothetical protein
VVRAGGDTAPGEVILAGQDRLAPERMGMDGEEVGEVLEVEVEVEVDLVHPLYRWENGGEVSGFLRDLPVEAAGAIQEVHGEEAEGDIEKGDTDIIQNWVACVMALVGSWHQTKSNTRLYFVLGDH